jgi:hypothetical protein
MGERRRKSRRDRFATPASAEKKRGVVEYADYCSHLLTGT